MTSDVDSRRPASFDLEAAVRKGYFGYQQHARHNHEQTRREELASHLRTRAEESLADATELADQARRARRDGLTIRADRLADGVRELRQDADDFKDQADRVRTGDLSPDRVDVDGPEWARINDDVGDLAPGAVEASDASRATDNESPPPIDHSRRYGIRGGLRVPLAIHQTDLERAMPRDADGRVRRQPDPRDGEWFGLANDGGPKADPTRGINCVDGVLALFDTYVHSRPRVSAPRTFDAYAYGDTNRPLGAEERGLSRIEDTVRGEFQGLCPYVGGMDHTQAMQAVDTAMTNLSDHLHNLGHGAFAFIMTDTEGGTAHAWAAVNQNGTILFLDPQTGEISEDVPLYRNHGVPTEANVVSMDALVVNPQGEYATLPEHGAGTWSRSSLEPTGAGPQDGSTPQSAHSSEPADVGESSALTVIADSDLHDPPGVGYFRDQYRDFDPQRLERAFLAALTPDQRAAVSATVDEAGRVAKRAHRILESVISSLPAFTDENRPLIVDVDNSVKTAHSLARAYVTTSVRRPQPLAQFLADQHDRVRFSIQVSEGSYADQVSAVLRALDANGLKVIRAASFWKSTGRHNGLNVTLTDTAGYPIEVQFPTERSRTCGKETHVYYEVLRVATNPPELQIDAFLRIIALNIRHGLPQHQPDLQGLSISDEIDTRIGPWLARRDGIRIRYHGWLREQGLTLETMVARHGLTMDSVFGTESG